MVPFAVTPVAVKVIGAGTTSFSTSSTAAVGEIVTDTIDSLTLPPVPKSDPPVPPPPVLLPVEDVVSGWPPLPCVVASLGPPLHARGIAAERARTEPRRTSVGVRRITRC